MSLKERYEKHKNFIQERWQPIHIKVLLQEDPEKKISIIKAAQKIQDQFSKNASPEFKALLKEIRAAANKTLTFNTPLVK